MEDTTKNKETINKYKQLVAASCKEPNRSGEFDDCTNDMLQELQRDGDIDSDDWESMNGET